MEEWACQKESSLICGQALKLKQTVDREAQKHISKTEFVVKGHFLEARRLHVSVQFVWRFRTLQRQKQMSSVPKWGITVFAEKILFYNLRKWGEKKKRKKKRSFSLENSLRTLAVNAPRTAFKQPNNPHKYECSSSYFNGICMCISRGRIWPLF